MDYKATPKFKELSRVNHHQGLDREDYDALLEGKTVKLENPPEHLVKDGYIKELTIMRKRGK